MGDTPLEKHTINLRLGDMAVLKQHFPKVGATAVIRRLVSDLVDRLAPPVSQNELEGISDGERSELADPANGEGPAGSD